ncbi:MAG: hypothetical protein ACXABY_30485 [Candidatus Thorarchaeota archaeon]|jgi:hypothetical protein
MQFKTEEEKTLFSQLMAQRPQLSDKSYAIARIAEAAEKRAKEERS